MKNISRLISLLLLICIIIGSLASCHLLPGGGQGQGDQGNQGTEQPTPEHIDYVSQVKLDMNSSSAKQEVTLKMHIDGDTSHFDVPYSFDSNGYIKARYLAINTPESTGKIEEWGKKASQFTEEKLTTAHKIIVESDDESWNFDGNGRYLVWVWYQPTADAEFRCLNIEILEAGLAVGSKTDDCRYGDIAVKAIAQAKIEKLYVFSNQKDPQFCYDGAVSVTLKELRLNAAEYESRLVSVEGIVVYNSNYTVHLVSYDPESGITFAMQVFYGYNSSLHSVLAQGNRVRVVGKVSDFNGTWQISGLEYKAMKPNDPANTAKIEENVGFEFVEITVPQFNGDVDLLIDEETQTYKTYSFAELAASSAVSLKNLKVNSVYTTSQGNSAGAMTLYCSADGQNIEIRTEVLKDANGDLVTEQYLKGKTIDVEGLVDYYNGYQIKVYTFDDITIH